MLGSHCRFSSIDSEIHRQIEEWQQMQTKTPRSKKVDVSLVDEVEHVLLLVVLSIEFPYFSISKHR